MNFIKETLWTNPFCASFKLELLLEVFILKIHDSLTKQKCTGTTFR